MYEPDRTVDIGSVTLAVDDRGTGEATPLVLIHGFTGGRIDWADVIDDLARDRRVVAWDHRGHSDSTNTGDPATYTFDQLVADALAVLDALGIDRFHLLGHSMGGVIAQRLVLEHPERVESLVLMDTLAEPLQLPREWVARTLEVGREQGMGVVADFMATFTESSSVALEADRPRIAARNRHKLSNMDVEAFAALGDSLGTFPGLLEPIATVACKTTVLVGEHDVPLRDQADKLAKAIPGADLVVIEGAAHCPQEERRDAWLEAVRHHLALSEG
jgi:pimeloyl-ACP methyl ester carboxylesterase